MKDETYKIIEVQKKLSNLKSEIRLHTISEEIHKTKTKKENGYFFFLSYARNDDYDGRISRLRSAFENELSVTTGYQYSVFQDLQNLGWGEDWENRITRELSLIPFLIAVITPSFLLSPNCSNEIVEFSSIEQSKNRSDLILPIYYVNSDEFNTNKSQNPIIKILLQHNYIDFRQLRMQDESSMNYKNAITELAEKAYMAIKRLEE